MSEKTTEQLAQEVGTVQHQDRLKRAAEREQRKKLSVIKEEWVEITPDKRHRNGGKVLLKRRLVNGNVHSVYVGREAFCTEFLKSMKREKKLRA